MHADGKRAGLIQPSHLGRRRALLSSQLMHLSCNAPVFCSRPAYGGIRIWLYSFAFRAIAQFFTSLSPRSDTSFIGYLYKFSKCSSKKHSACEILGDSLLKYSSAIPRRSSADEAISVTWRRISMFRKAVILALVLIAVTGSKSWAYTIDGRVNDWGVVPFYDWTPNSGNIDWTQQDDYTTPPVFVPLTEDWDIEAMYFDNDDRFIYFSIVTSRDQTYGLGDLAIDLDGDHDWDWGVDLTSGYYAADGQLSQRGLYSVTDWKTEHGWEYNTPMQIEQGTLVGSADVVQRNLGWVEPGTWWGYTYIIEGRIDIAQLGLTSLCGLPVEMIYAKVSCLRDWIKVTGDCDGNCGSEVPEPSTVLLLGSALCALAGVKRRHA